MQPRRELSLDELPPALARKLSFERAAPRRLRRDDVPAEAREVLGNVWDAVVAEVWDEVAGTPRRKVFDKERMAEVLGRVTGTLQQGERALIVAAVYYPLPGDAGWKHAAMAGAGSAGAAAAGGLAVVGSAGTGAAVAITTAVVGELFETYAAASTRTIQYRRAQRSPDPALVAADLAEALGWEDGHGRRLDREMTTRALGWLSRTVTTRAGARLARGLLPVAGAVAAGGLASRDVLRVARLELRPPAEDELARLAGDLVDEGHDGGEPFRDAAHLLPPPPPPPPR